MAILTDLVNVNALKLGDKPGLLALQALRRARLGYSLPAGSLAATYGPCSAADVQAQLGGALALELSVDPRRIDDALNMESVNQLRCPDRLDHGVLTVAECCDSTTDPSARARYEQVARQSTGARTVAFRPALTVDVRRALGRHFSGFQSTFAEEIAFLAQALDWAADLNGSNPLTAFLARMAVRPQHQTRIRDLCMNGLRRFLREYSLGHGSLEAIRSAALSLQDIDRQEPGSFLPCVRSLAAISRQMRPPLPLLLRFDADVRDACTPRQPDAAACREAISDLLRRVSDIERACVAAVARAITRSGTRDVVVTTCSGTVRSAIRTWRHRSGPPLTVYHLIDPKSPVRALRPAMGFGSPPDFGPGHYVEIESLSDAPVEAKVHFYGGCTIIGSGVFAEHGTVPILQAARNLGMATFAVLGSNKYCFESQIPTHDMPTDSEVLEYHELVRWAAIDDVILG